MNSFFLLAIITANAITTSGTTAAADFSHVTGIQCKMDQGYQGAWNKETLSLNPATMDTEIVFDQISLENKTARFTNNKGSYDVSVLDTPGTITFIEMTVSGSFIASTVFKKPLTPGKYAVTMSRHVLLAGEPVPSQYHGICEISQPLAK